MAGLSKGSVRCYQMDDGRAFHEAEPSFPGDCYSRRHHREATTLAPTDEASATLADIFYAYRLLLGRQPDEDGFQNYFGKMQSGGLRVRALRDEILKSSEFNRARGGLTRVAIGDGLFAFVDPEEPDFGRHIARFGSWEPHIRKEIQDHLKPDDVFIDVGANVGIMAFHAARAVGAGGKVIAFEPNPDNVQCLLHGVVENAFGTISLHSCGLSDRRQVFSLAGHSNSALAEIGRTSTLGHTQIGDDVLRGETRIDMIKIDIEGHEPAALRGLRATLAKHSPILLCEFNPLRVLEYREASLDDFAGQLFGISDRCIAIEHDGTRNRVGSPSDLMGLWTRRNSEAVQEGRLPDGLLHLDLLLNSDR